jgi:hypothetical protein
MACGADAGESYALIVGSAFSFDKEPEPPVVQAVLELLKEAESCPDLLAMRLDRAGDEACRTLAKAIRLVKTLQTGSLNEDHYLIKAAKQTLASRSTLCSINCKLV